MNSTTVLESDANGHARQIVFDWVNEGLGEGKKHPTFSKDEVYVSGYRDTFVGWEVHVVTSLPDERYYRVTYNRNKKQIYLDTYLKTHNQVIDIKD